jgi:uncharacterized membrane protein
MSTPETPMKPTPMRPGLRVVLVISLALNLMVAGVVAGMVFSGRGPAGDAYRVDLSLGPFARALAPEDVVSIRNDLIDRRRDMRRDRRAMIADTRGLIVILRDDPYDANAAAEILLRQRALVADLQTIGQDLVLARIAQMAPETRTAFAGRLEREMRRMGRDTERSN